MRLDRSKSIRAPQRFTGMTRTRLAVDEEAGAGDDDALAAARGRCVTATPLPMHVAELPRGAGARRSSPSLPFDDEHGVAAGAGLRLGRRPSSGTVEPRRAAGAVGARPTRRCRSCRAAAAVGVGDRDLDVEHAALRVGGRRDRRHAPSNVVAGQRLDDHVERLAERDATAIMRVGDRRNAP